MNEKIFLKVNLSFSKLYFRYVKLKGVSGIVCPFDNNLLGKEVLIVDHCLEVGQVAFQLFYLQDVLEVRIVLNFNMGKEIAKGRRFFKKLLGHYPQKHRKDKNQDLFSSYFHFANFL